MNPAEQKGLFWWLWAAQAERITCTLILSLSLITYARLCSTYKPRKHERSFSVDWIIVYLMSVWLEWIAAYVEKATTRFFPLSSIYLSIYCSLPSADKTTRRKIENKHETHTHTREHKNFKTNETIIKNLHLDTFVPPFVARAFNYSSMFDPFVLWRKKRGDSFSFSGRKGDAAMDGCK